MLKFSILNGKYIIKMEISKTNFTILILFSKYFLHKKIKRLRKNKELKKNSRFLHY